MSNLKPCPFCGKEPNQKGTELGDRPCFYYECENPKCGASEMGWHDTEQEAIDAWNNRPIEDALQARIEELENAAIVWHKYPEEKPIDGRYLFWDSDGNAPHVLPYNDIVVRNNPGVFSTQTHWAYLPSPPKEQIITNKRGI